MSAPGEKARRSSALLGDLMYVAHREVAGGRADLSDVIVASAAFTVGLISGVQDHLLRAGLATVVLEQTTEPLERIIREARGDG